MIRSPKQGRFSLLVLLLAMYSLVFSPYVKATDLEITDNGSGSGNTVNVAQSGTTAVSQENTANVDNSVQTASNTGDNSASGNSNGNTSVTTGDVSTAVEVATTANNSTSGIDNCCENSGTNAVVSGNGSGSNNEISSAEPVNTTVNVINNATITTSIKGTAVTGRNSTSGNSGGNVAVSTGDIRVFTNIVNSPINTSDVTVKIPVSASETAKIVSNGAGSDNKITAVRTVNPVINVLNNASIKNLLVWDLVTGGNSANNNSGGNVTIDTGSTDLKVFIKNLANLSSVKVEGCCNPNPSPTPTPNPSPTPEEGKPIGGNSSSSGSSFSGSSIPAGAEAGAGGPGVLGLSDTSSGNFQSLMFILGLMLSVAGLKLTGESLFPKNLKN